MLSDIIDNDKEYFFNKEYKDIFTVDHPNYMGDKHQDIKYEFKKTAILKNAPLVKDAVELTINRDAVARNLTE